MGAGVALHAASFPLAMGAAWGQGLHAAQLRFSFPWGQGVHSTQLLFILP